MKNKRLRDYLEARKKTRAPAKEPIQSDAKTDQDFPGYPHGTSSEDHISPENQLHEKLAAVKTKDGEKMLNTKANRGKNEIDSDGSGGAFQGTEQVRE